MSIQGEINYLKKIGKDGVNHAIKKPFSDIYCDMYLMELGAIMSLLPNPPVKLLDLGCGTGWTSIFFAKRGYDVTGQDISQDCIYYANQNKDQEQIGNVNFIQGNFEDMDFDSEFDCVVFFDALHHCNNENAAIDMAYKALKPGGVCITSEPGKGHSKAETSIRAVKKYNVTERDMPPTKIIKAGKAAGFKKFNTFPHTILFKRKIYSNEDNISKSIIINKLSKFNLFKHLILFLLSNHQKKNNGIVMMIK